MTDKIRLFPRLLGFESLFGSPLFLNTHEHEFRRGSSILIEGAPGSGKTAAAVAMCRALMAQNSQLRLFYISAEVAREDLKRKLSHFGWFDGPGKELLTKRCFVADLPRRGPDRPVPSSEQLINNAFAQIRSARRDSDDHCLVIVDSLTGFMRDSASDGDRRRLADDILDRIRLEFPTQLELMCLTNERTLAESQAISPSQYIADYVFRLGYHDTATGRRIRTWETVKSHGTYMVPGVHTWAIVSKDTVDVTFSSDQMRENAAKLAKLPEHNPCDPHSKTLRDTPVTGEYATIAVFPQVSNHLIATGTIGISEEIIWSGSPGLDELLIGDSEYWSRADLWSQTNDDSRWSPGLVEGGTSLLLGSSGTGKTLMLCQFLIANAKPQGFAPPLRTGREKLEFAKVLIGKWRKTLYISFEGWAAPLSAYRRMSEDLDKFFRNCIQLYPSPGSTDPNRLFAEVRWLVMFCNIERVAIDGLHEFALSVDRSARVDLVKGLIYALRGARPESPPTIMASYELTAPEDSLDEAEGVSALADNIVFLRQITLNDQLRKSICVLKARTQPHDRQVREVLINTKDTQQTPGLRIVGGFDGFSKILSSDPATASVVLQLFQENDSQKRFNDQLQQALSQTFHFPISARRFSRAELDQFVDDSRGALGQVPSTDIQTFSLDEWWLRELQQARRNSTSLDARASDDKTTPLLRLDGFFALREVLPDAASPFPHQQPRTTASTRGLPCEHWITEIEKGARTTLSYEPDRAESAKSSKQAFVPGKWVLDPKLWAMPNYTDFGIMCVNCKVLSESNQSRETFASKMPRVWADATENWFRPPAEDGPTVVDFMFKQMQRHDLKYGLWADFQHGETSNCFLLEIAWGFGVPEEFLTLAASEFVSPNPSTNRELNIRALKATFRLLQYMAYHGFLCIGGTSEYSREAVFSRHWYSTLNTSLGGPEATSDQCVQPIPDFPLGHLLEFDGDCRGHHIKTELLDLRRHLSGLVKRSMNALLWVERYWRELLTAQQEISLSAKESLSQNLASLEYSISKVSKIASELEELGKMIAELATNSDVGSQSAASGLLERLQSMSSRIWDALAAAHGSLAARQIRWGKWTELVQSPEEHQSVYEQLRERERWFPAAISMDWRDVRQILKWFRHRCLQMEAELRCDPDQVGRRPQLLAGFGCSGTWLLGVATGTHSPRLSWKLIEEMTSVELSHKRATMGAGIPTRKDFYEIYGKESVPRVPEEISWSDFFTAAGARVRRRDHAVCRHVPLTQFSSLLRLQTMRCIRHALAERDQVTGSNDAKVITESPSVEVLNRLNAVVDASVAQVLLFIANAQERTSTSHRTQSEFQDSHCTSCPAVRSTTEYWCCGSKK